MRNERIQVITERIKNPETFYYLVNNILCKWEMPKKEKQIFQFKIYYIPILTYTAEIQAQIWADISRLKAAEMIFLRSTAGETRRQRIRN